MRKYKVINRKRFISSVIILVLIISVVAGLVLSVRAEQDYTLLTVYAKDNDTLWRIASQYHDKANMEIRQYIELICKLNNITPDIRPNQAINVPVLR